MPLRLLSTLACLVLVLTACARVPTSEPVPAIPAATATLASSPTPQLAIRRDPPLALPAGVTVEEYPVTLSGETEGRDFVPALGSMEDVLAVRAAWRAVPDPARAQVDPNDPNQLAADLDGSRLAARVENTNLDVGGIVYPQTTLVVLRDGGEVYRQDLGVSGPVPLLRGLWTHEGHWVIEAATGGPMGGMPIGDVLVDGESLNATNGYEESFGFQTLAGRPFYFFQRDARVGAVYDGQEIVLDYDLIHHYSCCSGGEFNPIPAADMVSFFAQRNGQWYYAELGVYP